MEIFEHTSTMRSAMRISAAVTPEADREPGYQWAVRIVEFGRDKNGNMWPRDVLLAALDKFEGAKVFRLSGSQHLPERGRDDKGTDELIGWISGALADETGISGTLNLLPSARSLRDDLVASHALNPGLFALSVDIRGKVTKQNGKGAQGLMLASVSSVQVDLVHDPAAGGAIQHMVAAVAAKKEDTQVRDKLLAAIKRLALDKYQEIEARLNSGADISDEELATIVAAIEPPTEGIQATVRPKGDSSEVDILRGEIELDRQLAASKLPQQSLGRIRQMYEGRAISPEALRAAIKAEAEYVDSLTGSGRIQSPGGRVDVLEGEIEARARMLDDFFEGKLHSMKACYQRYTGDEHITGRISAASRLSGAVSSTTWAEALGDSITRRMLAEYKAMGLSDWRKIVSVVPVSDFRTQHRVVMGGFGDLPTVAEGDAYTELSSPGDSEATYSISKKGGTQTITREAIKNDDVGAIRRIPTRLARAAARTLYKFVFDFLRANGAIYDSVALFHSNHSNLGSTALASAALITARTRMMQQTEADSSEVLGIPPKYLIVPTPLAKTGYDLIAGPRNGDFDPTSADFTRTWQLELIEVPYWSDANNWFLAASPMDIPGIEIGFLDGREEPELLVQDAPDSGSVFSNDAITYKIRHEYSGAVTDYRAFDGSIVA